MTEEQFSTKKTYQMIDTSTGGGGQSAQAPTPATFDSNRLADLI